MTVILKFKAGVQPPYREGDIATFTPEQAQLYLDADQADVVAPEDVPPPPAPATKPLPEDEMVILRFHSAVPPYRAGDIATFSVPVAALILDRTDSDGRPAAEEISAADIPAPAPPPPEHQVVRSKDGGVSAAPRTDLVKVLFTKSGSGYRAGELAGFAKPVAELIVKEGYGVFPTDKDVTAALAAAQAERGGDPDPASVSPDVEVAGLDDRAPDWREKAMKQPPADKMSKGGSSKGRG